jgi:formate hydrogenlyase transcriptional activator
LSTDRHFDSDPDLRRYEALLELGDLVVQHHSLPELFVAIAQRLQRVVAAETAKLSLHDPTKNVMRLHLWEGGDVAPVPLEVPVEESASGWVWQNQQPLPVPDLASESRFLPIMSILRAKGLKS